MHPRTHYHTNKKGFTLSELLISLAVLGLISALTLPSIFNNVEQAKKKAALKEAITTLSQIVYQANAEGVQPADFATYFASKATLARWCPTSAENEGCTPQSLYGGLWYTTKLTNPGAIFPSGVGVAMATFSSYGMSFKLDYNGDAGPNITGIDQMDYWANLTQSTPQTITTISGTPVIARPGELVTATFICSTSVSSICRNKQLLDLMYQ
ncbi:MAG: type II secretion system protein [Vampirovibrionales bacterium]